MTCKVRSLSGCDAGPRSIFDSAQFHFPENSMPREPPDQEVQLTRESSVHDCPHHPSSASWYWDGKCQQCSGASPIDDADYRFARWPRNDSYSLPLNRLPPISNEIAKTVPENRRQRRRSVAACKYPYTYPRKGSDTNPSTLTGRVLSIYREGLSTIGRTFKVNPTSTPWKC